MSESKEEYAQSYWRDDQHGVTIKVSRSNYDLEEERSVVIPKKKVSVTYLPKAPNLSEDGTSSMPSIDTCAEFDDLRRSLLEHNAAYQS